MEIGVSGSPSFLLCCLISKFVRASLYRSLRTRGTVHTAYYVDDDADVDGVKQGDRRRCRCHPQWMLALLIFFVLHGGNCGQY